MADNALGQRRILRVALGLEPVFEEHYGPLWAELRKHTILERVETPEELVAAISGEEDNGAPLPWALLITDAALTEKHYSQLWKRVVEYIRDGAPPSAWGWFSTFARQGGVKPFRKPDCLGRWDGITRLPRR